MQTGVTLTDEASAMESSGYQPRLVPCVADNIKITESADLALANVILQAQLQAQNCSIDEARESSVTTPEQPALQNRA